MSHVTPGNRLYLYALFVREIGVGKQTALARMEEVLIADDILPCDMGFEDVRSLLEELSDFVRLTVFRKGRIFATVMAQPEWDEILARLDEQPKEQPSQRRPSKSGPKSWKRKRNRKDPRPAKPRPHGRPKPEAETVEEAEVEPAPEPEPTPAPEPEAAPAPESEPAPEPEPQPELEPEPDQQPELEPEPDQQPAPAPEPEPQPELEPEPDQQPVPAPVPHITLTVISRPDPEPDFDDFDLPPETEPAPTPAQKPSLPPLPRHIATDVYCNNEQLALLYQILPFDLDPITLLDEDWREARSTETYELDGANVTFPLRYLQHRDGNPLLATLRRGMPSATGKRWTLVSIGDGALTLDDIGFEGLPLAKNDAWHGLATYRPSTKNAVSPARELAHYAHLGPWEDLLTTLASLAAPEPWGTHHELLREYLSITFARIRAEKKLVTYEDGNTAFNTGLHTPSFEPIYMVFSASNAPSASCEHTFVEFTTTSGDPAPSPATYVRAIEDITVVPPFTMQLARPLRNAYPHTLEPAAAVAATRVQRDYRICTPAYDPVANETRLLLPLSLDQATTIDRALVLARVDNGTYVATAVMDLKHAATCARVVSAEIPRWLAPQE